MKAVVYARFSSDKQTEESIEAQVRACREYAAGNGITILEVYADEAISGKGSKTLSRKQYQRMLRDLEHGKADCVLIHKYDRIARSLAEHVTLETRLKKWNVQLIAVGQNFGTSNEAKIMRAMVWAMSEYYSDNLANETRKGLKEIALQGRFTGGVAPFGYDVGTDGKLVINEIEAHYVRRLFDAALARIGYKDIIAEMSAAGIVGKRGKPITNTSVHEILRNEKYTGTFLYCPVENQIREDRRTKADAIRIENAFPAIVSREQWTEVQRIMNSRKQAGRKAGYLCSGLVYCKCGAKMHAQKSKRKGHEYAYYICSAHCGFPVVRVEDVDEVAKNYLVDLLGDENQLRIYQAIKAYKAGEKESVNDFQKALQRRIAEKNREYNNLMKNLSTGQFPASVIADIAQRMETLKNEIAVLETTEPPKDITADIVHQWLENIKAAPSADAIKLLISRIDVDRDEETEKTVFNISSTLNTVLGKYGCGGWT